MLLAHALGVSAQEVLRNPPALPLPPATQATYDALLSRRASGEPLAKIIGRKPFWKHEFYTTRDTLDPRPESELVIEAVLRHRPDTAAPLRFLDCGTGTGCLLLSLLHEYPHATGDGIDISASALEVAMRNATHLHLNERASFHRLCWTKLSDSVYDIVIGNPPYIPTDDIASLMPEVRGYDPIQALDGGSDGLEAYRQLFAIMGSTLTQHGLFVCEIGHGQEDQVSELAEAHGMTRDDLMYDLAGIPRVLVFRHRQ